MLKFLFVVFICQLSSVLTVQEVNSHPLLFESKQGINVETLKPLKSASIQEADLHVYGPQLEDVGHATNCGNKSHNFSLTWIPKKVNPSRGVKFNLDMIAAMDFQFGNVSVSIYTGGSTVPFITDTLLISCPGIQKKFPDVKCPIKKGEHININYIQSDLTALPPGSYTLKADITVWKTDFLCAKLDVVIME